MGTRVSGLEIKHWKSGEVLCKMLLFLVVDKYESEGYKRKYWRFEGRGEDMNRLSRWVGQEWTNKIVGEYSGSPGR